MNEALEVAGVKLTVVANGVELDAGWLMKKEVSREDALKIRDWLNWQFPAKGVK